MDKFDFEACLIYYNQVDNKGHVITSEACEQYDGEELPLISGAFGSYFPANVVGCALLESREDGLYAKCHCNFAPGDGPIIKQAIEEGHPYALTLCVNAVSITIY